jgi:NADPH:quinone reductase-like Zn-dependent oxidoreductase
VTAYYALFNQLGLPNPSELPATTPPPNASTPILIYGGGASSGQYMIQLLALAGYKKILATASKHNHEYLLSLGATDVIDYNDPGLVEAISKAAGGDGKIPLAVDCICSEATSMTVLTKVISPSGRAAFLLPLKEGHTVTNGEDEEMYWEVREEKTPFPSGTKIVLVRTFEYQEVCSSGSAAASVLTVIYKDTFLRDNLMPKILPKLLESGDIKPNRPILMNKGSFADRVKAGLEVFRTNQAKGGKVIVKVTA